MLFHVHIVSSTTGSLLEIQDLCRPVPRHNINFGINTLCLGADLRDPTELQGHHQVPYGQGRS